MVELFKEFQEVCVDTLAATHGEALEISAYLTDPEQIEVVLESYVYGPAGLNSRYVPRRNESFLRLTKSVNGQFANNVVEIGRTPRIQTGASGFFGGNED